MKEIMNMEQVMNAVVENILIPLALAAIPIIGFYIRKIILDIVEFVKEKSAESLQATIVTNALNQIDAIVESAVSSNNALAEQYKKANADGKLTDEEKTELKESATKLAMDILPKTVTSKDVINLIGGNESLIKIIESSIEKALLKIKK